jgi:hypothetical protein
MRAGALLLVLAGAAGALLFSARAGGDPPADDGVPRGTVAFFAGGLCPEGWMVAADAAGRLILPVTSDVFAGKKVGQPLGPEEDRAHRHTFAGSASLPAKNIAAANGGNQAAAAAGEEGWSVEVAAPSGLPFIQLLACEKP